MSGGRQALFKKKISHCSDPSKDQIAKQCFLRSGPQPRALAHLSGAAFKAWPGVRGW